MRRGRAIAPVVLATAALGLAVAGCGGGHGTGHGGDGRAAGTHSGKPHRPRIPVLHVVASLPLTGPAASQGLATYRGVKLALTQAGGRAGVFPMRLYGRNDAGLLGSPWNAGKVATNALQASTSASTILYIGELASGATASSTPILSEAGIPQISPGSPATDIQAVTPTAPAAPHTPLTSTLLRLGPSNRDQARAILAALKGVSGCTRVALLAGSGSDADDLAKQIEHQAAGYQELKLLTPPPPGPGPAHGKPAASPLTQFLGSLPHLGANCGIYTGSLVRGAATLISHLHQNLLAPAVIVGSSAICTVPWPDRGLASAEPAALDPFLECAAPGPPLTATAQGRAFLRAFRHAYGVSPDPAAAYGYEAMKLGLQVIRELGPEGDRRSSVLRLLQDESAIDSPVGTFAFGAQHQTTNTDYTVYRFKHGTLARVPAAGDASGATTTGSTSGTRTTRSTTTRSTTTRSTTTRSTTTRSANTRSATTRSTTTGTGSSTRPASTRPGG